MTGSIALSLIQNTAILLSFILLYDYIWAKEEDSKRWYEKVLAGVCVGCIGLVLMKTPGILQDGLIFDTRTILLTISGLFLGFIPTVVAIVITGINRIIIGGNGVWMGLATILSAAMMLRHSFKLEDEALLIEKVVLEVLEEGYRTGDIMSEGMKLVGTEEIGKLVMQKIEKGI